MSYTCRLYINSGFNSINIPDGPGLLNSASIQHIDVPALQVLQNRELQYIDVKTSYDTVRDADYCRVGEWFYFIDGVQMLTADVARITLYADYLTSAGGVAQIHILDGVTNRVHVSDDEYGKYNEADPFMAPAEPLELVTQMVKGTNLYTVVVKSSLDLSRMGQGEGKIGVTYTDSTTGETVTVPATIANDGTDDTVYKLNGQVLPAESRTKLFDVDYPEVKKALQEVNDLGVNGSITAQVALPLDLVEPTVSGVIDHKGSVIELNGKILYTSLVSLPFVYYQGNNMKVNYSEHTPYGIITASGDTHEYTPSRIYTYGLSYPTIKTVADPRVDGKPYYRFSSLDGDVSDEGFFREAVEGRPWRQVPLVYEGEQGIALTQLALNQSRQQRRFALRQTTERAEDAVIPAALGMAWGIGQTAAGGASLYGGYTGSIAPGWYKETSSGGVKMTNLVKQGAGMLVSGVTAIAGAAVGAWGVVQEHERAIDKYYYDRNMETQAYLGQRAVASPVVDFPFAADLLNDMYRNPVIAYRYKYTDSDAARIDKILNMYGYKVMKPIESSDFVSRKYFNYVDAGVSVTGLPRWWANGIAVQISSGIRVWHVKPNESYYSDNPINE